jgi:hypothetical protein
MPTPEAIDQLAELDGNARVGDVTREARAQRRRHGRFPP